MNEIIFSLTKTWPVTDKKSLCHKKTSSKQNSLIMFNQGFELLPQTHSTISW